MRILIVGIGALGGIIATHALSAGTTVRLATRTEESARRLRSSGLRVSGIGGQVTVRDVPAAAVENYEKSGGFDLVVLATKAREALEIAPLLSRLLVHGGTLLPIQNGGVSQILSDRLGSDIVLGGLSNLGATMVETGVYEQLNAGHLLIGELAGGLSERATKIARELSAAVETRVTSNMRGAIWAKMLLNCSVTTIGAVAAQTMRQYITTLSGRAVFHQTYDEALSVALASGVQPERMIVEPIPPGWRGAGVTGYDYDAWIDQIVAAYGDIKASMLQDFERGRRTEIDFINGHVARLGRQLGIPTNMNEAVTNMVHRIERGEIQPNPRLLEDLRVLSEGQENAQR